MLSPKNWSIRTKLALSFVGLTVLSAAVILSYLYFSVRAQNRATLRNNLTNLVGVAALQVDGDLHAQITSPEDQNGPAYQQLTSLLRRIQAKDQDIYYIYSMRPTPGGQISFVLDADEEPSMVGEIYSDPGPVLAARFSDMSAAAVEDDLYTDEWGVWLSGYAPIVRADGSVDAILGIDIAANSVLAQERALLWKCLIAFAAAVVLTFLMGIWMAGIITSPVRMIASAAGRVAEEDIAGLAEMIKEMASGNLNQSFSPQTQEIQYTAKDEIGALARAYNEIVRQVSGAGEAFNQMSGNLNYLVSEVSDKAGDLSSASEQLAKVASQAGAVTSHISGTIQQIAEGTAQQAESVNGTSASVDQISGKINGLAAGTKPEPGGRTGGRSDQPDGDGHCPGDGKRPGRFARV